MGHDHWDTKQTPGNLLMVLASAATRALHCAWASNPVNVCASDKKGDGLKDDRRLEQKSNHLIATFFISIFCFMAAEGRRTTPAVIHGRSGGR